MNWKWYGRKQSWINLKYYIGICHEGLWKTMKNLSKDSRSPGRDLKLEISRIQSRNANLSTVTFGPVDGESTIYLSKQVLVAWSVDWWLVAVKGCWALWGNIYECVCSYNRCHGSDVTGFWALWHFIYVCVCACACVLVGDHLLLRDFWPHGIIFVTLCVYYFKFSCRSWWVIS
jgi:hypothetical protein